MSTVLDNHYDPDYEPTEAEILEYGKWLGLELPADADLLTIAREGLKAPLPENWKACKSEKGELYYFNFKTGASIWDHPMDEWYKTKVKDAKAAKAAGGATAVASAQVAPAAEKPATVTVEVAHASKKESSSGGAKKSSLSRKGADAAAAAAAGTGAAVSGDSAGGAATPQNAKVGTNHSTTTPLATIGNKAADDAAPSKASHLPDLGGGGGAAGASAAKKGSKLTELKTLKVKKVPPAELLLDTEQLTATPAAGGSAQSTPRDSNPVPSTTTAAAGRAPLHPLSAPGGGILKNSNAQSPAPAQQQAPQATPNASATSAGAAGAAHPMPKFSPIPHTIDSPNANVAADTPAPHGASVSTDSKRSSAVSFLPADAHNNPSPMSNSALSSTPSPTALGGQPATQVASASAAAGAGIMKHTPSSLSFEKAKVEKDAAFQLQAFKAEQAERLQKEKDAVAAQLDEVLRQAKTQLKATHHARLVKLQQDEAAKLAAEEARVGEETQKRLREIREKHEEALRRAAADAALKEKEAQQRLQASLARETASAHDSLSAAVRAFTDELATQQREFANAMGAYFAAQREFVAEESTAVLRDEKARGDEALEAYRRDFAAAVAEKEASLARLRAGAAEAARRVAEEEAKHEIELERVRRQHADELQALHDAGEAAIAAARAQQQQQQSTTTSKASSSGAAAVPPVAVLNARDLRTAPARPDAPSPDPSTDPDEDDAEFMRTSSPSTSPGHPNNKSNATEKASAPAAAVVPSPVEPPPTATSSAAGGITATELRTAVFSALLDIFRDAPHALQQQIHSQQQQQVQQQQAAARHVDAATFVDHATNTTMSAMQPLDEPHQPSGGAARMGLPPSYSEQTELLRQERERVAVAEAFLAEQREALADRRAALKLARRNWKKDVTAAKAEGVSGSSKRGTILRNVHKCLDKQAEGLDHDERVLDETENWLRAKASRVARMEAQLEAEFERWAAAANGSNGGVACASPRTDVSTASVDTALLVADFYPPTNYAAAAVAAGAPASALGGGRTSSRSMSTAVVIAPGEERAHAAAAAAATARSRSSGSRQHRPATADGIVAAAPSAVAAADGRHISPQLTRALERIENRLDRFDTMMAQKKARSHNHRHRSEQHRAAAGDVDSGFGVPSAVQYPVTAAWSALAH